MIFAPAVRSGAIYDDKHVLGNPDVTAPWADAWAGGAALRPRAMRREAVGEKKQGRGQHNTK